MRQTKWGKLGGKILEVVKRVWWFFGLTETKQIYMFFIGAGKPDT